MMTRQRTFTVLITGLLILALPAILLADEPETSDNEAKVIIVGDDGEELTIDMEAVHEMVAEAMTGLDDVMEELEDMQLQVRLGKDNRLDLSYEDTTFELDLDQIMTQVAVAVQSGFEQIHTEDWTDSRDRWSDVSEDDLRQELEDLQKEMKELRREIGKIKDQDED
jgi:Cu/Ag efflux pump CusA